MSQDQQTYTRATTAALVGLVTHFVLTIVIAVVGVYTESRAVQAVSWYVIAGLPIWSILWVLYNQHRLERIESLEAAQLADRDARNAALFDESGSQLAQARKRLDNLYKRGLPIISALTAAYLLALGGFLLLRNLKPLQDGGLIERPASEDLNFALISLLLILFGLVGFLVSRYVAGMTRIKEWQSLRGGASYLIGNVFLGLLPLLIGLGFLWADNTYVIAYLAVIIPGFMVLLGLEIVLGFVLGMYRPRKADEFVRPAFDSRVLGWLTRPESIGRIFSETLNYQFGFEISKSWFMQLLGKALVPLSIACILMIAGMSCVVIVEPHEQAAITTNGAFSYIAEPGINFKAPWPIGKARKYDVNRIHSIALGSRAHAEDKFTGPILWNNQHVGAGAEERYLITAPHLIDADTGKTDSLLGEMLGADIDVKYRILNLEDYLGVNAPDRSVESPETLLRIVSQKQVIRFFATHDTESLLTTARENAGETLQAAIQDELASYNIGLEVVYVSVSGIHPPQEVAEEFHQRINAMQQAQTTIEQAKQQVAVTLSSVAGSEQQAQAIADQIDQLEGYTAQKTLLLAQDQPQDNEPRLAELDGLIAQEHAAIELSLLQAGGQAGQLLMQARAYRWSVSLQAQARALRRNSEMQAFHNAPLYYPMRRYLDMLAGTLSDRPKLLIVPLPDAGPPNIVVDLEQIGLPSNTMPQ